MLTFRAVTVLRWIAQQNDPSDTHVPEEVMARSDAHTVYYELTSAGLADETETYGGSFSFHLTPTGRVEARNAVDSYRAELVARRVLQWTQEPRRVEDLLDSPLGRDFTGALTAVEVKDAVDELEQAGLLTGPHDHDGQRGPLRATASGRAALRNQYAVLPGSAQHQPQSGPTHISTDNYGPVTIGNQVVGSNNGTMNAAVTTGVSLDEVLEQITQLRNAVADIDDVDDPTGRDDAIEDIDRVVAKGAQRGLAWVKRELVAIASLLVASVNQGMADHALAISASIVT